MTWYPPSIPDLGSVIAYPSKIDDNVNVHQTNISACLHN